MGHWEMAKELARLLVIWVGLVFVLLLVERTRVAPLYMRLLRAATKPRRIRRFLAFNGRVVWNRKFDSWQPCIPAIFVYAVANTLAGSTSGALLAFAGMVLYLESCLRWVVREEPKSREAWVWVLDCGALTLLTAMLVVTQLRT